MGYSTLFWVRGTIFGASDPRYTVLGPTSKLVVFAFSGRLVGYITMFWVPGRFSVPVTPGSRFLGRRQNSSFSRFLDVFVGFNTLFCVPRMIFGARNPRYTVTGAMSKLVVFWPFSWAIAHFFGFRRRFSWPVTPGTRF